MTTEEAYTPIWCCTEYDRLCDDCYEEALVAEELREMEDAERPRGQSGGSGEHP
jgi:hypothetical protein